MGLSGIPFPRVGEGRMGATNYETAWTPVYTGVTMCEAYAGETKCEAYAGVTPPRHSGV